MRPSNFQSTFAKARPNDRPSLREERRQVHQIVIDVGIYLSMDQPPRNERDIAGVVRSSMYIYVSVCTIQEDVIDDVIGILRV